jgi:epoxyqueuosine reductase
MAGIIERLYAQMEEHGLRGRVVSIGRLRDLQAEIESRRDDGDFDEAFYQERLTFFDFTAPQDFLSAASLIVVAAPRAQTRTVFTWRGETHSLILPPTYQGYRAKAREIRNLLAGWLAPDGCGVLLATLPNKLVAVRSGLAEYGRNNISYVPGMGSFAQLVVFYSDLPCQEDGWREPRMMDRCRVCRACLVKCPTGAITAERFLLRAERCLVFHNERVARRPFPSWIPPDVHNSPMGCMVCQQVCPEDEPFLGRFEGDEVFSHEETEMLLRGASSDRLPDETRRKLERLELLDSLDTLPRNLGVFFKEEAT